MANWEKLNKEFDDALDSMTSEDWGLLASKRIKQTTRTMKTAVEWLVEQIIKEKGLVDLDIQAAKEMEKEHIKDAYKADLHPCSDEDAEQYYNETFKQQEQ
jgi:3-mercaptopyruvate sulfurtransferase SseA